MSDYPSSSDRPLVSAVVPTRDRGDLLDSAIRSALRQTWTNIEVIVVVDGPDPATAAYLDSLSDSRIRVVYLPERLGGSDARNVGVRAARGEWIGFLDDDDEWLPDKIERQMAAAHVMRDWFPIVSCRLIAQSPTTSRVLPVRVYEPPEPIADFLFCRTGLRDPGGVMQTSTLLAPRDLLLAVPFLSGLPMHQDIDWLIRASSHEGVGICMLARPLVILRIEGNRPSVGRNPDWKFSLSWIRQVRPLISPQAFSWFVAIQCTWRAQHSRAGIRARISLMRAFLFEGTPHLRAFLGFLIYAFVPASTRRAMRSAFWKTSGGSETAPGLRLVVALKPAAAVLRKSSL